MKTNKHRKSPKNLPAWLSLLIERKWSVISKHFLYKGHKPDKFANEWRLLHASTLRANLLSSYGLNTWWTDRHFSLSVQSISSSSSSSGKTYLKNFTIYNYASYFSSTVGKPNFFSELSNSSWERHSKWTDLGFWFWNPQSSWIAKLFFKTKLRTCFFFPFDLATPLALVQRPEVPTAPLLLVAPRWQPRGDSPFEKHW